MADEKTQEDPSEIDDTVEDNDESESREPAPPKYFIHSAVRKRHTRLARMKSPKHHDLVQRIGGLVIRRSRPIHVPVDKLEQILPELRQAHAEGRLELRTADGRLVNLHTGEIGLNHPVPPLPNPLPDSAARDKPAGIPVAPYLEGTPMMQTPKRPSVLPAENEEDEDDEPTQSIPPQQHDAEARVPTNPPEEPPVPPPPAVPQISHPEGGETEDGEDLAADPFALGESNEAFGETKGPESESNEPEGGTKFESVREPPPPPPGAPEPVGPRSKRRGR
jgi:hypothetical protein